MPTIQALLKLGADVNKAGFGGWTPAARCEKGGVGVYR